MGKYKLALLLLPLFLVVSGCKKTTTDFRDQMQVLCHENDAIVVRCARFAVTGEIYYLKKEGKEWRLEQKINLKPYLKRWHVKYLSDGSRYSGNHIKPWIQYNGDWLCILLRRGDPRKYDISGRINQEAKAVIFKRKGNHWEYYSTISRPYLSVYGVALIDDYLFINDPFKTAPQKMGVVYCYQLNEKKPRLTQKIISPAKYIKTRDYWFDCSVCNDGMLNPPLFAVNDNLIIRWAQKNHRDDHPQDYSLIYRLDNGSWVQKESFEINSPSEFDKYDVGENRAVFYFGREYFPHQFSFDEENFGRRIEPTIPKGKEKILESQTYRPPFGYNVFLYEKDCLLGIVKPSEKNEVVSPDWAIDSGDPETLEMMTDYYKSLKSYYGVSKRYLQEHGYSSYYEYTNYIPVVDFATCGSTLVTSYVFDECYIKGSPLQAAKVWAGVNVYEIDPEQGPKRVLALTTSNLGELKVVP